MTRAIAALAALALAGCATSYSLQPTASDDVRYKDGVPFLRSAMTETKVAVAPGRRVFNGRMSMVVGAWNNSSSPLNFGPENIRVSTSNGTQLRVYSIDDLEREADRRAGWQTAIAAVGAVSGTISASQPTTAYVGGTPVTVYDPAASEAAQSEVNERSAQELASIEAQKDRAIGQYENSILRTTTVDPGSSITGSIVIDKPTFSSGEQQTIHVTVDFGPDHHAFELNVAAQ
jgi:hypothetical protein